MVLRAAAGRGGLAVGGMPRVEPRKILEGKCGKGRGSSFGQGRSMLIRHNREDDGALGDSIELMHRARALFETRPETAIQASYLTD